MVQFVVIPTQGFANRMKMIASTAVYAQYKNVEWKIAWAANDECSLDLNEIFSNVHNVISNAEVHDSVYHYFGHVHVETVMKKIDILLNGHQDLDYIVFTGGHEFKPLDMPVDVFIQKKKEFYHTLQFHEQCTGQIQQHPEVVGKYLAIHYRDVHMKYDGPDVQNGSACHFTDNSPLLEFEKAIASTHLSYDFILILSNSNKAYNYLTKAFPYKDIRFIEGTYERDTKEGMIHSIKDFVNMTQAKAIYGSYYSSFSDEAAFFGNKTKYVPLAHHLLENSSYHCYGYSTNHNNQLGTLNLTTN